MRSSTKVLLTLLVCVALPSAAVAVARASERDVAPVFQAARASSSTRHGVSDVDERTPPPRGLRVTVRVDMTSRLTVLYSIQEQAPRIRSPGSNPFHNRVCPLPSNKDEARL